MSENRNLPRNTLFSAISAFSNLLLLILVIFAGRILGDADYGKFSLAMAVASIFEMMIDFGLNTLVVKSVARDRSQSAYYLHAILPWKTLLSVVMMLLLIPTAYMLTKFTDVRIAIYAMGIAIVLRSFKSTTHSFFRAYERFDLVLLTTYTERIIVLLICGLILFNTRALIPFTFAFALARTPDLIFSFWLVHQKIQNLGLSLNLSRILKIQREAVPFGSLNIVTVTYAYIGTVILGIFRSPTEIGWYSAGYRVYEGLTMFPFVLCTVLLPRLSELYLKDRDKHSALSGRALKYMMILSFPIVASGWILSPHLLSTVFGPEYIKGTMALRILISISIFMFANLVLNTVLVSADEQGKVLQTAAAGLFVSVTAHFVLVPRYGIEGAAIAALTAEIFVCAMFLNVARRKIFGLVLLPSIWRPPLASMSALVVLYWSGKTLPILSFAIFALIYIAVLFVLRTFDNYELSALKSILPYNRLRSR